MAGSEDGEDCAMKYLKEQQKNPSGPRKTKPRSETDAAMEYLKGQLAKQKKTSATGRTSPKVPLPDYLKGIRLQAAQTERSSPEPSTRTASNPNSPGDAPSFVRDAHFSPVSDVRKTLELMHKVTPGTHPQPYGPLSPQSPLEPKRSTSAKRLRQCSPPSPLSWTTRSLRVPPSTEVRVAPSSPAPSRAPGTVPSGFRELDTEGEATREVATAPPAPASWVKTYTDILEKSQKSQKSQGSRFESPVRRVVPGTASRTYHSSLASPIQTWRSGRPPPQPAATAPPVIAVSAPLDLSSLGSGSFRLAPPEEGNGYHSARIRTSEPASEVAQDRKDDATETRLEQKNDDVENVEAANEVIVNVDARENAPARELGETSPPSRPALTPCNTQAPNPSPKKPGEIKSDKTQPERAEQTEQTRSENRPPKQNEVQSQPRLAPSGAMSPPPASFRQREYKPVQRTVAAGTTGTATAATSNRIQGISTCITPSVMPCPTPPTPLTPPVPWQRVTGFELKPCLGETATSVRPATTQWFPYRGVYRTYSVTARPWFPKTEPWQPWNAQAQGSPLRRRQINV